MHNRKSHMPFGGMLILPITATLLALSPQAATGHGHEPPWLNATTLEHGVYAVVQAPRVVRRVSDIELTTVIRNVSGRNDVTVEQITYLFPQHAIEEQSFPGRLLPTQGDLLTKYENELAQLHELENKKDRRAIAQRTQQCRKLLQRLAENRFAEKRRLVAGTLPLVVGSDIKAVVEIHLSEEGVRKTLHRDVLIRIRPPLPRGTGGGILCRYDARTGFMEREAAPRIAPARSDGVSSEGAPSEGASSDSSLPESTFWFAGDQHVHTTYSLDAVVLDGTEEDVTDYATVAESMGLDWMMVTDHSNVHADWNGTEYYTPDQFNAATTQAAAFSQSHPLIALVGQEMGLGQTGFWNLPSHYLAHPFMSDSTGYIANPSSGLVFGLANCEAEQVIIDRVNNAGGFGFIAHPFDSGSLAFAEWDFGNGAVGWAGLEIWSDTNGTLKSTDDQAIGKWHDLLGGIAAPHLGELNVRSGFPNAFPVGLGNSDAHQPGLLAATFTYAWMPEFTRAQMVGALMRGQCIASNGPLLYAEAGDARIGEVALLAPGDNDLNINLATTMEFGPVGNYELRVLVNGALRHTIPPTGLPDDTMQLTLDHLNLQPPDSFVTLQAESIDGTFLAFTNPIWLQFPMAGDMNDDDAVNTLDVPVFTQTLLDPPVATRYQRFAVDMNQDMSVDGQDIALFVGKLLE